MKKSFILIFIILAYCQQTVFSNNLLQSRKSGNNTYVYQITEKEAYSINYKKRIAEPEKLLHTLIDSYPSDSNKLKTLASGHYIKMSIVKNKQIFRYLYIPDFDVKILNNNTDLCVRIYNLKGELLPSAKVSIRGFPLSFDSKTKCYIRKKSNAKGLLTVTVNGLSAYYDLSRDKNNPWIKRAYLKTFYSIPIAYVWIPLRTLLNIPIDAARSIGRNYAVGSLQTVSYLFKRIFHPNQFSDVSFKGYMVFNKPKYLPGDTVKFKAYIVNKKGESLKHPLDVTINNGKKDITLCQLVPYYPGAFEYSFVLHDSLNLKLDQNYLVSLKQKNKSVFQARFMYEDYILDNIKLGLRAETDEQFIGKKFKVFVRATDDNELNIPDSKVELILSTDGIVDNIDRNLFLPDTLWKSASKLNSSGETEIIIPDSVFPKANFEYIIRARLLTSDNKTAFQTHKVHYYYERNHYTYDLKGDSVKVHYFENGKEKNTNVSLTADDSFYNETFIGRFTTPFSFKLNPFYADYCVAGDKEVDYFELADHDPQISCTAAHTYDSVSVKIINPRKLNFVYNIYQHNSEVMRGSGDSLTVTTHTNSKENYYISIRYLWGGEVKSQTYTVSFQEKKLNVELQHPTLVFPGQKVKLMVKVTDQKGEPVEGVDITAFSLTNKFHYITQSLPYLGKLRSSKELINNFSIEENDVDNKETKLNYSLWNSIAGLDSIEYYKFIYPKNGFYRFDCSTFDGVTQFTPYVVDKYGNIKDIQIIYVDNRPVYFAWSDNIRPYSFAINQGKHQIKLRLANRTIILSDIEFNAGQKTIFSVLDDVNAENILSYRESGKLSASEKLFLKSYIFPYSNNFINHFTYIENDKNYHILSSNNRNSYIQYAGPITGEIKVVESNNFSHEFYTEPGYYYDINSKVVKLRELKSNRYGYEKLTYKSPKESLSDTVVTKMQIDYLEKQFNDRRLANSIPYLYMDNNSKYKNSLSINYQKTKKGYLPSILLLVNQSDVNNVKVCKGENSRFYNIVPGNYKVICYNISSSYYISDAFEVMNNGKNFVKIILPEKMITDSMSDKIRKKIEQCVYNVPKKDNNWQQVWTSTTDIGSYDGEGTVYKGKVVMLGDNEPVIGAVVTVPGTKYGVITDVDGNFIIKVPINRTLLDVSYLGCKNKRVDLVDENDLIIALEEDEMRLEEVVVIGYGVQKKSLLTGSVSTVSNTLQGKTAGVAILKSNGFDEIRIRANSLTDTKQSPLLVVDGKIYDGNIDAIDPTLLENVEVLKDASATALYGARATNGVILITTKGNAYKTELAKAGKGADYDQAFLESLAGANTLRTNFSDYAFWQPRLSTNKEGETQFEVTFPDDITKWDVFVLAMNNKKQTGQTMASIKSYKPLMTQLAVPEFLTSGDTCALIGKLLNYLPDSVIISTGFDVNGDVTKKPQRYIKDALIDTLSVSALSDSMTIKYTLKREDGYYDGEQRQINVKPIGVEQAVGSFIVMDKDSIVKPVFDKSKSEVILHADAGYLDVLKKETARLIDYKYNCNEQVASKLIALLSDRAIAKYEKTKPVHDNEIKKYIRELLQNQTEYGLWGWWPMSDVNYQFSLHVLQALSQAKGQNFNVDLDSVRLAKSYITKLEQNQHKNIETDIALLKMLKTFDCVADYGFYLEKIQTVKQKSLNNKLQIMEIQQMSHLPFDTTILKSAQHNTVLGNVFYSDGAKQDKMSTSDIQNTLIAYRIIRAMGNQDTLLVKINRYLLENKQQICYWNTYETAQILQTILPDMLKIDDKNEKTLLIISGSVNKTISEFPATIKLNSDDNIQIDKKGKAPVYLTTYQHYWNDYPQLKKSDFIINTYFENSAKILKAGRVIKLIVELEVKKEADYVMINVPIPASCVYDSKPQSHYKGEYREHFKTETNIYCEKLKAGKYLYEISLLPKFSGVFTLNPAKVELMYFPTFNANNELRKVRVE